MTAETAQPSGVIHDIGYRNYEGERVGRLGIVRALYWHSLRSSFGIGRGGKAKIVPAMAFVIMCLPAVVNAFTVSRTGIKAVQYDEYIYNFQLILVLYLAAVTPELISRDLRNRTLPLYFSRPLRRSDYPLAKVSALITAVFALTALPELFLYVGTIGSLHTGSQVWHETRAFFPGLLISAGYAVFFALLATVLTCFTGRRAFATGAVAVFFFGTFIISQAMIHITGGFGEFQNGPPPGGGPVGGPGGPVGGGFFVTPKTTPVGAQIAGMLNPGNLLEGLRVWIVGHADVRRQAVPYPNTLGAVYLVVALAVAGLCALILVRRYRKAGLL